MLRIVAVDTQTINTHRLSPRAGPGAQPEMVPRAQNALPGTDGETSGWAPAFAGVTVREWWRVLRQLDVWWTTC